MTDDTISRQAAIDALGEEPLVWHEDDVGEVAERNQWRRDVAAIKALPSAQPGWIPCSETEETPEYEVIACNADGEEMLGYLSTDGVDWECDSAYELMTDVVAWMKKPKPWEGEQNG